MVPLQVWNGDWLGEALLLKAQKLSMTFGQVWLADPPSAAPTETRTQWRLSRGPRGEGACACPVARGAATASWPVGLVVWRPHL